MMSSSLRRNSRAALILLLAGLAGCGAKKTKVSPIDLLNGDRADLQTREHDGPAVYDRQSGNRFTGFFGGTSAANVSNYLDTRLHYYFDPEDADIAVSPADIFDQNWLRDDTPMPDRVKVGAANIGVMLWMAGQTAQTPVSLSFHGQTVPVESTRAGIMMIGEGYDYRYPVAYRQSILIHEARHSDCTGGVSQAELYSLRHALSATDANRVIGGTQCGHMHVKCPVGHTMENLAACDNESWGAYTAGEVYLRGIREDSRTSADDRAVYDAAIVDFASRTLVSRSGKPDLSSSGVR